MTAPILSPDGTQYWDGTAWLPLPSSAPVYPAPIPTVDPPATASAAGPAGVPAAPGVSSPPPTWTGGDSSHRLANEAAALPNDWATNKWAWLLALSPMLFIAVAWLAGDQPGAWVPAVLLLAGATAGCYLDAKLLQKRGADVSGSFTAAVLLLYVIGAPAYLIHRTRHAGTTKLVPVAWFVSAAAAVVVAVVVNATATPAIDVEYTENYLISELTEGGVHGAQVDCPDDEAYSDGDMVICSGTSTSDGDFEIVLEMRNDGYYSWEPQQ